MPHLWYPVHLTAWQMTTMTGSFSFKGYRAAPTSLHCHTTSIPSRRHWKGLNSMDIFQTVTISNSTQRVGHKASRRLCHGANASVYVCLTLPDCHLLEGKDWVLSHFPSTVLGTWPNGRSGDCRYRAVYPFPEEVFLRNLWGAFIYSLVLPTRALECWRHYSVSGESIHIIYNLEAPFTLRFIKTSKGELRLN